MCEDINILTEPDMYVAFNLYTVSIPSIFKKKQIANLLIFLIYIIILIIYMRKVGMKTICLTLLISILFTFSLFSLGDNEDSSPQITQSKLNIPPIDLTVPSAVETASFALG